MKDPTTKQTIKLFWEHAWRYPGFVVALLVSIPLTILVRDFGAPYILSQVLDHISRGDFNADDIWASFGTSAILYALAVYGTDFLAWRFNIWLIWQLELRATRDIANRVFEHLMQQSANFHNNRFGGSIVSQANKLVGAYVRTADTTIFNLLALIVSIIFTICILGPQVPIFVAILLLITAIYVTMSFFMAKRIQPVSSYESHIQSKQTGYLADSIANIMAIKSFAAGRTETKGYRKATFDTYAAGEKVMWVFMRRDTYASLLTATLGVSALLIAIFGASHLHVSLGTLFLIVTYTGLLGQRLWDFNQVMRNYNRALGDASDMVQILQIEPEIKDPAKPQKLRMLHGAIKFDRMSFTHPEANETLFKGLELDIKAGEKIGLVGHSGSGKTTLTKLLLRFNDIDSGAITIDGQDIRDVTQDDLRRSIAYVPQEPLLFHRSIRENIAYGKPGASKAEVAEAARKAHAAEFIEKLPQGYDTLVGERGVKLSGGQRQRIAIARAILKDAPILLLDEATSALDSESERLIQAALWELMKGRTAIVIAHRLSTVQKMDRIVVMHNGTITEQGAHAALIAQGGTYAELWAHQSGGFIEE